MAEKGKKFPLSITIRTVDRATAGLKRINDRLEHTFAPTKRLGEQFKALHENLRLPQLAAGFRGIGGMVRGLATHVGVAAGVAGAAALGFKHLVDQADELGDRADQVGLTVDALAQLRFAAEEAGAASTDLDQAMEAFGRSVGQAKAGTGRLTGFLKKVSPALLKQLKATTSNEEAFGLMADAMAKVKDPAKRAALAAAAFGTSGIKLGPLLARGSKGIQELRDEFLRVAGPQQDAVDQAGKLDGEFRRLSAAAAGVKAQILVGLGPAFLDLTGRARSFFEANRGQIGAWIRDFGEKLPGRLAKVGEVLRAIFGVLKAVVGVLREMVGWVGGAENAVKLLAVGFAGLKAAQLIGHLGGIAQGFIGIASAARGAAGAMGAANAAAAAGQGAGAAGSAAGAAGTAGKAGQFIRSIPFLGAVLGAAVAGANAIDSGQDARASAKERGAFVQADLKAFRERQDAASRKRLEQSLRDGGFVDPKTGRFNDTVENRQALAGGRLFEDAGQVRIGGVPMALEIQRRIDELNSFLRSSPPQKAEVAVRFENAPKGMRATVAPGSTADVNLSTGYQLVTP